MTQGVQAQTVALQAIRPTILASGTLAYRTEVALTAEVTAHAGTLALDGDPAAVILGDSATPEAYENLREQLGLNDPLPVQYLNWLKDAVRGDLGRSISTNRPVSEAILDRLRGGE